MSNTLSTYEDDTDDSEVAGAYGDVLGKSIEKLKDVSTVSFCYSTLDTVDEIQFKIFSTSSSRCLC